MRPCRGPLDPWYRAQSPETRAALVADLVPALRDLLDLGDELVSPHRTPPLPDTWPRLRTALAAALDARIGAPTYAYGRSETDALVRAMTHPGEGERPLSSLVQDAAEILALPREQRTEYVTNTLRSPPWRIRKLLLEYALRARAIDELVGVFSKGFCATSCDQLPVGCCHILGYDLGLVPEAMLEIQGLEARWQASAGRPWRPMARRVVERKCRYHTDTGCVLARFKSPACIGYQCPALVEHLQRRYPAAPLEAFLDALARFRNQDLDRRRVFEAMEGVMATGQALLRHEDEEEAETEKKTKADGD